MKLKLYQIDPKNCENKEEAVYALFSSYDYTMKKFGRIDPSFYECVFDGEIETDDLEGVYQKFNLFDEPVSEYCGRSMSVSDIVEVIDSSAVEKGVYFCDSVGFKKLDDFDSSSIPFRK